MKTVRLVCVLAAGIAFGSCKEKSSLIETVASFTYPMQVGNEWNYTHEYTTISYDTTKTVVQDSSRYTSLLKVAISKADTLRDTLAVKVILSQDGSLESRNYYQENLTGLFSIAYIRGGLFYPKSSKQFRIAFAGRIFSNTREVSHFLEGYTSTDSLVFENSPVTALRYPIASGAEWDYRPSFPFRINKRVIGVETITVPAGTFTCYKIEWRWDMNRDSVWDTDISAIEYTCDQGLIKRTFFYRDLMITDELGKTITLLDATDEAVLTSFTVSK